MTLRAVPIAISFHPMMLKSAGSFWFHICNNTWCWSSLHTPLMNRIFTNYMPTTLIEKFCRSYYKRSCKTFQMTVNLRVQHNPFLPNPTSIFKHKLQYAGFEKCLSLHTWQPSSFNELSTPFERDGMRWSNRTVSWLFAFTFCNEWNVILFSFSIIIFFLFWMWDYFTLNLQTSECMAWE